MNWKYSRILQLENAKMLLSKTFLFKKLQSFYNCAATNLQPLAFTPSDLLFPPRLSNLPLLQRNALNQSIPEREQCLFLEIFSRFHHYFDFPVQKLIPGEHKFLHIKILPNFVSSFQEKDLHSIYFYLQCFYNKTSLYSLKIYWTNYNQPLYSNVTIILQPIILY